MTDTYQFTIDGAYRPDTLPMGRLAEYMGALAKLLGEGAGVHFVDAVRDGSAVLPVTVDQSARPKVRDRVEGVRNGTAAKDAHDAFTALDALLRKDNATGRLVGEGGAVIIPFPGRDRPEPVEFGPFRQDGTLDGQIIRVGGSGSTIPVHLLDGETVHTGLYTSVAISKELAAYYRGPTVRVRGNGAWLRLGDGVWTLREFKVTGFDVLDDAPLTDIVADLRRVGSSGWGKVDDPVAALMAERESGA